MTDLAATPTREELLDSYEAVRQEQVRHSALVKQKLGELEELETTALTLSMKVTVARDALLNRMDSTVQEIE